MQTQKVSLTQAFTWLAYLNLTTLTKFAPGLDKQQLIQVQSESHLKFPKEVQSYFRWHNGILAERGESVELFPMGYICSLAECLRYREMLIDLNRDIPQELINHRVQYQVSDYLTNPAAIVEFPLGWNPRWLPLFVSISGDYWFTICGDKEEPVAPIYFIDLAGDFYLAYDNLTALLLATAEAFEQGAYYVEENTVLKKHTEAARIIEKYNPNRRKYLLESANAAKTIDEVVAVLVAQDPKHSAAVYRALQLLGDQEIPKLLQELLQHEEAIVRLQAVQLINDREEFSTVAALRRLIDDPDPEVRRYATWTLQQFQEKGYRQ